MGARRCCVSPRPAPRRLRPRPRRRGADPAGPRGRGRDGAARDLLLDHPRARRARRHVGRRRAGAHPAARGDARAAQDRLRQQPLARVEDAAHEHLDVHRDAARRAHVGRREARGLRRRGPGVGAAAADRGPDDRRRAARGRRRLVHAGPGRPERARAVGLRAVPPPREEPRAPPRGGPRGGPAARGARWRRRGRCRHEPAVERVEVPPRRRRPRAGDDAPRGPAQGRAGRGRRRHRHLAARARPRVRDVLPGRLVPHAGRAGHGAGAGAGAHDRARAPRADPGGGRAGRRDDVPAQRFPAAKGRPSAPTPASAGPREGSSRTAGPVAARGAN